MTSVDLYKYIVYKFQDKKYSTIDTYQFYGDLNAVLA